MNLSGSSLCVHDIYFLCSGFIISLSLFIFAISIICYLIFSLVYPVWAKIIFYFLLNFFSDDEQCNWNGEWGACENALAQARTWEQSERIKKNRQPTFFIPSLIANSSNITHHQPVMGGRRVKAHRMILFIYYFETRTKWKWTKLREWEWYTRKKNDTDT